MAEHERIAQGLAADEVERALRQFQELLDPAWIASQQADAPQTVYTAIVTVWLLVQQRLHSGASLSDVVHELLLADPRQLPANRRVREGTLSASTAAYSNARQRLRPEVTDGLAERIFTSLLSTAPASLQGRRAFFIDGTTIALPPTRELQRQFPPATNQHGPGVWPIAHLLVAHELESGCAALPEVGAKFGPAAQSEAELARALLQRLPAQSLVVADRNFGIFSVACAAQQAGHDALFRLTGQRFKALWRRAQPEDDDPLPGERRRIVWRPSAKDRRANPDLPADAELEVWLHEVRVSEELTLLLLTTWPCSTADAAHVYGRRIDVETDIRDVKVQLRTEHLPAKSVPMLRKELAASICAYNLVVQVRRLAAQRARVPPRRISFARTLSAVRVILLRPLQRSPAEWLAAFELALRAASQHKLPNRPGRSYPRRAHPKRTKSNSGTKTKKSPPPNPPPEPK